MKKNIVLIVCLLISNINNVSFAKDSFLSPERAFHLFARIEPVNVIQVHWEIEEGYHMYKKSLSFKVDNKNIVLGVPIIPKGIVEHNKLLNITIEEYTNELVINIPVKGKGKFKLQATGQGCADAGLCYAPFEREVELIL
jgi:thiol:disulfide interchange protein DsbD